MAVLQSDMSGVRAALSGREQELAEARRAAEKERAEVGQRAEANGRTIGELRAVGLCVSVQHLS